MRDASATVNLDRARYQLHIFKMRGLKTIGDFDSELAYLLLSRPRDHTLRL